MPRLVLITVVLTASAAAFFTASMLPRAQAHCEVPCGIYDDPARVTAMLEDTTTIAKAIDQINALAGKSDPQSLNQITRWVMNKELHAERIQETMSRYFLAQRVKPQERGSDTYNAYVRQLVDHHAVIVAAMKAKQSTDPQTAAALREAIEVVGEYYPPQAGAKKHDGGAHDHAHAHDHDHHGHDHDHDHGHHGHDHDHDHGRGR